jgi:hypothetical protein
MRGERIEPTEGIVISIVCSRLARRYGLTLGKLAGAANREVGRSGEHCCNGRGCKEKGVDGDHDE